MDYVGYVCDAKLDELLTSAPHPRKLLLEK